MNDSWLDIWNKKYAQNNYSHIMAGFDNLTEQQYGVLAQFSINKMNIKPADSVLDVGCGNGAFINFLPKDIKIAGVDYSRAAVDDIVTKFKGDFIQASADNLPFADESFDVVYCWSLFQYFDSDQVANKVLSEMRRVTKNKGLIYVGDIQDKEKLGLRNRLIGKLEKQRKHVSTSTPNSIFYDKKFFLDFALNNKLKCTVFNENIPELAFYIQSNWRFSVLFQPEQK